jgi:ABC-type bacteriocin/lantibiotic exporter with double-glycine peptidase domain
MGRTHVAPIQQPDDTTCGPSALKLAFEILGKHKSLSSLITLCKTNKNGTSTKKMIAASNKLGYAVEVIQYATLHHLQSALRYPSNNVRAVLVSYLYDVDTKDRPHPDSGHWAVVSSYAASKSRIVLLDSASGKKKSYAWADFRRRWMDYDLKRRKITKRGHKFHLIKSWQQQLLVVIAQNVESLPCFRSDASEIFTPSN